MKKGHKSNYTDWPCEVRGKTHLPSGKAVRMQRWIDGAGDLPGAVIAALKARPDRGRPFIGETVEVATPLNQKAVFLVEADHEGNLVLEQFGDKTAAKRAYNVRQNTPVPKPVDPVFAAFPAAVIGEYLPTESDLPPAFRNGNTVWHALIVRWFANGLPADVQFFGKDGIDAEAAWRHIDACLRSYEPRHQHKVDGCAYLCSCFFKRVVCPGGEVYE